MQENEKIVKKKNLKKEVFGRLIKRRSSRFAFYLLLFFSFIGVFAPYIANDQPLYVSYKGKTYFPAFENSWIGQTIFHFNKTDTITIGNKKEILQFDIIDWRKMETTNVLWPLVPFSSTKPDYYNRDFVSPGDAQLIPTPSGTTIEAKGKFRHLLGTDDLGRDVLAGLIHGTRISLAVGLLSMLLATILGLIIGVISGYFGDDQFKINRISTAFIIPAIVAGYFLGFIARSTNITEGFEQSAMVGFIQIGLSLFILIATILVIIYPMNLIRTGWLGKKIAFPIDSFLSRATEVFNSLPKLLLIISLTVLIKDRSFWLLIMIIGFTSWTEIARLTRAELLRIRSLDYISAAKAMGLKNWRIIYKHALPNAMSSVFVSIAFGIASAILIESGLSFLGIGVPEDAVTWGSMLSHGKQEMEAWWLVVFPGLAILITTVVFNLLGDGLRDSMDPRLKQRN